MTIDEALVMIETLLMDEIPREAVDVLAAEVRRLQAERDELKRVVEKATEAWRGDENALDELNYMIAQRVAAAKESTQ